MLDGLTRVTHAFIQDHGADVLEALKSNPLWEFDPDTYTYELRTPEFIQERTAEAQAAEAALPDAERALAAALRWFKIGQMQRVGPTSALAPDGEPYAIVSSGGAIPCERAWAFRERKEPHAPAEAIEAWSRHFGGYLAENAGRFFWWRSMPTISWKIYFDEVRPRWWVYSRLRISDRANPIEGPAQENPDFSTGPMIARAEARLEGVSLPVGLYGTAGK